MIDLGTGSTIIVTTSRHFTRSQHHQSTTCECVLSPGHDYILHEIYRSCIKRMCIMPVAIVTFNEKLCERRLHKQVRALKGTHCTHALYV